MLSDGLEHIRGMSDPFFYTFNIPKDGLSVVAHGVIFVSFEVSKDSQRLINLAALENDPRGKALLRFIWSNHLKDRRQELETQLGEWQARIAECRKELSELTAKLKNTKKSV